MLNIKNLIIKKESKNIYLIIPIFLIFFSAIALIAISIEIFNIGLTSKNLKVLMGSIIFGIAGIAYLNALLNKDNDRSIILKIDKEGVHSYQRKVRWNDIESVSHISIKHKKYLLIYPTNTYVGCYEYYTRRWTNERKKVIKIDITATNFKTFKICRTIKYNLSIMKKEN